MDTSRHSYSDAHGTQTGHGVENISINIDRDILNVHSDELGREEEMELRHTNVSNIQFDTNFKYSQLENELIEIKLLNQRLNQQLQIANQEKEKLKQEKQKQKSKDISNEVESDVETESDMDSSCFDEVFVSLMQKTEQNKHELSYGGGTYDIDRDTVERQGLGASGLNLQQQMSSGVRDEKGGCKKKSWACAFVWCKSQCNNENDSESEVKQRYFHEKELIQSHDYQDSYDDALPYRYHDSNE